MGQFEPGSLSGAKRLLGLGGLALVIVVALAVGMKIGHETSGVTLANSPIDPVLMPTIGFVFLFLGALLWGFAVLTNCMTFDFSRSYLGGYRKRIWLANIVVGLPIQTGIAFMAAPTVAWMIDSVV